METIRPKRKYGANKVQLASKQEEDMSSMKYIPKNQIFISCDNESNLQR